MTPRRLYFYAGKIIYPNYEIFESIKGMHDALINEETMKRIFQRLKEARRPHVMEAKHDKNNRILTSMLFCA